MADFLSTLPDSNSPNVPAILVGAFDRHNFGDMLFPHIMTRLLEPKPVLYGGLVRRDLSLYGGHEIESLSHLSAQYADKPVHIVHVGGELLTCSLWEAAVMLLPVCEAQKLVLRLDDAPSEQLRWAQAYTGMACHVPYTLSKELFPCAKSMIYNAIGGVELLEKSMAMRNEISNKLDQANRVTVRDRFTQKVLLFLGIESQLIPDPAVMVAKLFSEEIFRHASMGEPLRLSNTFSQGYIAVQFSNEFGDDQTLAQIATQLDAFAEPNRYGIVLFRAGAAPWHDDLSNYHRLAGRLRASLFHIFNSLNIWDICALIASSRAYCGSSLHGLIVASALARPGICIGHPTPRDKMTKHEAYIDTWGTNAFWTLVEAKEIATGLYRAMQPKAEELQQKSRDMAAAYCEGFSELNKILA